MQGCLLIRLLLRDLSGIDQSGASVAEYLIAALMTLAEDQLRLMSAEEFAERFGKLGTQCLARYWSA